MLHRGTAVQRGMSTPPEVEEGSHTARGAQEVLGTRGSEGAVSSSRSKGGETEGALFRCQGRAASVQAVSRGLGKEPTPRACRGGCGPQSVPIGTTNPMSRAETRHQGSLRPSEPRADMGDVGADQAAVRQWVEPPQGSLSPASPGLSHLLVGRRSGRCRPRGRISGRLGLELLRRRPGRGSPKIIPQVRPCGRSARSAVGSPPRPQTAARSPSARRRRLTSRQCRHRGPFAIGSKGIVPDSVQEVAQHAEGRRRVREQEGGAHAPATKLELDMHREGDGPGAEARHGFLSQSVNPFVAPQTTMRRDPLEGQSSREARAEGTEEAADAIDEAVDQVHGAGVAARNSFERPLAVAKERGAEWVARVRSLRRAGDPPRLCNLEHCSKGVVEASHFRPIAGVGGSEGEGEFNSRHPRRVLYPDTATTGPVSVRAVAIRKELGSGVGVSRGGASKGSRSGVDDQPRM